MQIISLFFCLKISLSIFYLKRNPQNGKYWFKRGLEKKHDNHFSSGFALGIIGTSSAFVKKKSLWLCFTDGNIWPSKFSNGPQKMLKGAKHRLQNF